MNLYILLADWLWRPAVRKSVQMIVLCIIVALVMILPMSVGAFLERLVS